MSNSITARDSTCELSPLSAKSEKVAEKRKGGEAKSWQVLFWLTGLGPVPKMWTFQLRFRG